MSGVKFFKREVLNLRCSLLPTISQKCKEDIGKITLLHLDCDLCKSTKLCLNQLYDNAVKGGFIVIDDYGHLTSCKEAVDEFINEKT
jgi:O-methyltransferase